MKRLIDILVASAALLTLSPLFLIISIVILLTRSGPVITAQKRIGKDFKPFNLLGFAGLRDNRAETAHGEAGVSAVEAFLRRTGLERLPQLWNVLKGEMSLIGPQPAARTEVRRFKKEFREVLRVRPGLIDAAALAKGKRAAQREVATQREDLHIQALPEWIRFARDYAKKSSISYDLNIACLAAARMLYPKDAVVGLINAVTPYRTVIVVAVQLAIFTIANYAAFLIRFDADVPAEQFAIFLKYLPFIVACRGILLPIFSLNSGLWRYTSVRELLNIAAAVTIGTFVFMAAVGYIIDDHSYPRSIFVIDWFLNLVLLGGVRLFRRFHERVDDGRPKKRVLVIGAGSAAEMMLRDIENSSTYHYEVVGLIDDNPVKKGLRIRNIPIKGTRTELQAIVEKESPDEFLIAIPSAASVRLKGIIKDLRRFGLPIKMLPSLREILNGGDSLSKIKVVEPEDILFRAPVSDKHGDIEAILKGKRVLITGAGGSIGSELSRQVAAFKPSMLILLERHEESLYKIDMELKNEWGAAPHRKRGGVEISSVIADILDEARVAQIMEEFRPEVVFHAAAYKHVPLMEMNPYEAVKTNVIGTKLVSQLSVEFGVERFIMVSTDKAVNPVNVMGFTKKMAEETVIKLSECVGATKFMTVRFGNVLESSGSVVPLFRKQIISGGPVTVTHPDIIRYFMTIPEAVTLILQAACLGDGGEVFVLDMGEPVKILDLAKRMMHLYGYTPGVDMEIVFTGLRPGEKLYEELFNKGERVEKTRHPKINKAISSRDGRGILELVRENQAINDDAAVMELLTMHFSGRDYA